MRGFGQQDHAGAGILGQRRLCVAGDMQARPIGCEGIESLERADGFGGIARTAKADDQPARPAQIGLRAGNDIGAGNGAQARAGLTF